MAEPLILLGFLALKAEQYARFPSISKMSDDWHQIAMIAAKGYNALRAHDEMEEVLVRAEDVIRDWEKWTSGLDTFPPDDLLEWSRRSLEELAALKEPE